MIRFLLKGLLRDRSRSVLPVIVVVVGVMLTVFMFSWMNGVLSDIIYTSARFNTGHVKIMSRAYAENSDQLPNDLALLGIADLTKQLRRDYPEMSWTPRIHFGGLLDIPGENGETRAQGPAVGRAVDLFSPASRENELLQIEQSLVTGHVPQQSGEILVSQDFSEKLGVVPGDTATLISSTMYGSMAVANFIVAGTVRFGITGLDRGAIIADISDIQTALDMMDGAGEI
ncbi:ABC transporter permease, partial [bacterium]|nr:ABC transporter permease [bacterium]